MVIAQRGAEEPELRLFTKNVPLQSKRPMIQTQFDFLRSL